MRLLVRPDPLTHGEAIDARFDAMDQRFDTVEERLAAVFNGPPARVGCIPAITSGQAPLQSLPVEREAPGLSPGQINPGLTPGMNDSPRSR